MTKNKIAWCSKCGKNVDHALKHCPTCGTPFDSPIDTGICNKCGKAINRLNRFCQNCGAPIYLSLDSPNLKNEDLSDIFYSLQNLICNREGKERDKYISKESEEVLYQPNKRLRDEFPETRFESGTPNALGKYLQPMEIDSAIANVFGRYRTNALTGYAARVAEELHTGKQSGALSKKDVESLINDFIEQKKKIDGNNFKYSEKDLVNPVDRRLIFCEALSAGDLSGGKNVDDGKYLRFTLEDKRTVQDFLSRTIAQNLKWTIEATERIAGMGFCRTDEEIKQKVVGDIIFGYCVRLGESLDPTGQ